VPGNQAGDAAIDIEVVPIKPEWLCNTFGFHPMLGFRKERQKRSIAHGCASTLLSFARLGEQKCKGWNMKEALPKARCWADAFNELDRRGKPAQGKCWLRESHACPFVLDGKKPDGKRSPSSLPDFTRRELSDIWRVCPERETHLYRI
jgi:hypothetical protein